MALIALSNGKTIDVDILWYLSLTDEQYQDLIASNSGCELENPFYGSSLSGPTEDMIEPDEDIPEDPPEIPERDDI